MTHHYDAENIFAKILRKELPCIPIFEDELTLVIMDIMPQKPGHVLVIPKQAAQTIYQLDEEHCLACLKTVKIIGQAVQKAMKSSGTTVFQLNGAEAGQTVPHVHFHILPGAISQSQSHASQVADQKELVEVAEKIINSLNH